MQDSRNWSLTTYGPISADNAEDTSRVLISREALFLMLVCTLDLISSAILFHQNLATEANPVLRWAAEMGTVPFCLAKAATFVPALIVAEWYRRRRPQFVKLLLRSASVVYVFLYCLLVLRQFTG